jgi:hypothetical protein
MFLKLAIPIFRGNPCESTESDLLIGISARTVQTGNLASSVRTISIAYVHFLSTGILSENTMVFSARTGKPTSD